MIEPTPELARQLDAARTKSAREMTFEQRALAGLVMFDIVTDAMRGSIRHQFPDADEERVEEILVQRLTAEKKRDYEAAARRHRAS